jgi:hypothetical protein
MQLQLGDSLAEFLVEATPDPKLRQLMMSMSEAIRTIAYKVRPIRLAMMRDAFWWGNKAMHRAVGSKVLAQQ